MTIDQFLDKLAKTPRNWRLGREGRIRIDTDFGVHCPLMACADEECGGGYSAAESLGIIGSDVDLIIKAADQRKNTNLRRHMLIACGL